MNEIPMTTEALIGWTIVIAAIAAYFAAAYASYRETKRHRIELRALREQHEEFVETRERCAFCGERLTINPTFDLDPRPGIAPYVHVDEEPDDSHEAIPSFGAYATERFVDYAAMYLDDAPLGGSR